MSVYINNTIMYATLRRLLAADTFRWGSMSENCIRSRPGRTVGRFDCAAQAALAGRYPSATTCSGQMTNDRSIRRDSTVYANPGGSRPRSSSLSVSDVCKMSTIVYYLNIEIKLQLIDHLNVQWYILCSENGRRAINMNDTKSVYYKNFKW